MLRICCNHDSTPFFAVTDAAGVVIEVGPGVKGFQAGDRVVAMLNSRVSPLWILCYFVFKEQIQEKEGFIISETLITFKFLKLVHRIAGNSSYCTVQHLYNYVPSSMCLHLLFLYHERCSKNIDITDRRWTRRVCCSI